MACCSFCKLPTKNVCKRCRLTYYCNDECQRKHVAHDPLCNFIQKTKDNIEIQEIIHYWISDFGNVHDIPVELLNTNVWHNMAMDDINMLAQLAMRGTEPNDMFSRKQNIIREIMGIGLRGITQSCNKSPEDHNYFTHDIKRVVQLGYELVTITVETDPGYIMWFMQCDMLSFPKIARKELEVIWDF
jgi:hypothetical protein